MEFDFCAVPKWKNYFQTKTKNLKTDFKELLNQAIKELINVDELINEIWEVVNSENFIC